jgi:hypothetical protein
VAFGDFTLTGTVQRLDGKPAIGARVLIYGVPPTVVNAAGDTVRAGLDPVRVDLTGKFTVKLPSDATTGNSTTIGFRVVTQYRNGQSGGAPVEFYARPIGSTVDLSDIIPPGGVAESLGATAANLAAAQAAADRAERAASVVSCKVSPTHRQHHVGRDPENGLRFDLAHQGWCDDPAATDDELHPDGDHPDRPVRGCG